LAAILDRLDQLVQARQSEPDYVVATGEIVLKEPEKPAPVLARLPDDFPGKDALEADGIIYLETVPRTGAELTAIDGVGVVTANKILTWLKS